ncbi:serine O-acetyltransferase EpsC [Amycolatopsis sp. NPDC059021]|uniref:serine O-acetyltransferase EpsC n=1 Tax=Amycolatopsis sp. NPDC059021 TaxID=3346704 RepID=UPI00366E3E0D
MAVVGRFGELSREDITTAVRRDPSIKRRREAILYPHVLALFAHRIAHHLYGRSHFGAARLVGLLGRFLSGGIDIHPGATLGRRVFIDHGSGVVIGETAMIGDDVTLYQQVTLGALGWQRDMLRGGSERRHPIVGDGVTIGAKASVLGPVVIGDGAYIGAHALVTHNVPARGRVRAQPADVGSVEVSQNGRDNRAGPGAGDVSRPLPRE